MKGTSFSIADSSVYVPEAMITLDELAQLLSECGVGFPKEERFKFESEYGLRQVPIERELSLEQMIERSCEPLLVRLARTKMPIDRILFLRTMQVHWHDRQLMRRLIHDYGLQHVPVYSVSQHNCASLHLAFRLCSSLFSQSQAFRGILLVAADKAIHHSQRKIPDSINGDSAGACYITRSGSRHNLMAVVNNIDGGTYDGVNSGSEELKWYNISFYFALRHIILSALKKASMTLADVRLIIGSNVNLKVWEKLADMLDYPLTKMYTKTIGEVGHLYCNDVIYNLNRAVTDGSLNKGDCYMLVTMGLGGTYGCSVHRY